MITVLAFMAIPVVLGLLPGALGAFLTQGNTSAILSAVWALAALIMSTQVPDDAVHIGPGMARLVFVGAVIGLIICTISTWRRRNQGNASQ